MSRTRTVLSVFIVLAIAATGLSTTIPTICWAQQQVAKSRGYVNGYADGYKKGQEDKKAGAKSDYKNAEWRKADRGFDAGGTPGAGSRREYVVQYRDGYERGYKDGYEGRMKR